MTLRSLGSNASPVIALSPAQGGWQSAFWAERSAPHGRSALRGEGAPAFVADRGALRGKDGFRARHDFRVGHIGSIALRAPTAFLFLFLFAVPAFAQSVVADLTDARASYPTPMSQAQIGELLTGVATRHPGFVLLRKDTGNHCPTPMGIFVACDILVDASSGQGYDVLRDQEGAGAVQWALSDRFPVERFVRPITVPVPVPTPIPQPVPVPTPVFDPAPLLERIDRLEAALLDLDARTHADTEHQRVWLTELQARPIVTGCKARADLGFARIPVSCEVK